jgi:5-methyltetrahydrofolate--homocysteine methyltransferase
MVKALADRFAEAFAEYLHEKYARNLGYSADVLTAEGMIAEEYKESVLLLVILPVLTI